jgi:hypothetical protein
MRRARTCANSDVKRVVPHSASQLLRGRARTDQAHGMAPLLIMMHKVRRVSLVTVLHRSYRLRIPAD